MWWYIKICKERSRNRESCVRAYADSRFLESIHKKLREDDEGIFLLFLRYLSETLEFIYHNHVLFFNRKLALIIWQDKRLFGPRSLCIPFPVGKSLHLITFPVSSSCLSHTLTHLCLDSLWNDCHLLTSKSRIV